MFSGSSDVTRRQSLRGVLDRWALHYTSDQVARGRIVERVIMLATEDETVLAGQSVDRALFSLLHRVAKQHLFPATHRSCNGAVPISRMLAGKRVLIAEDEYVQASAIADLMRQYGADVIGPFPRGKEAVLHLRDDTVDAAILDVFLAEGKSFELADTLKEQKKPFIFLTGYDRNVIPQKYRDAPYLAKPQDENEPVAAIASVIV